ncbi:MAG: hypothetical protein Q9164_006926, partial [Protoblastenia rupestris]
LTDTFSRDEQEAAPFHALANLLSMRSGGQLGALRLLEEDEDLVTDDEDEILSEAETDQAGPIAT